MADLGYYETLGVQPSCAQEDITRAFHQLARAHHPDVNADDPDAAARFQRITEAYHVLSDPNQRAQYDLTRANDAAPNQGGQPAQESASVVVQRSVSVNSAEVEAALDELRTALAGAASEAADELRGALRDFTTQLDAQINAIARAANGSHPPNAKRKSPPRRR